MKNVKGNKNKVLVSLLSLITLSGCATYNSLTPPIDVLVMPNDCANYKAIENWLDRQLNQPKAVLTPLGEYNATQKAIKYKIWSLRYNCNS